MEYNLRRIEIFLCIESTHSKTSSSNYCSIITNFIFLIASDIPTLYITTQVAIFLAQYCPNVCAILLLSFLLPREQFRTVYSHVILFRENIRTKGNNNKILKSHHKDLYQKADLLASYSKSFNCFTKCNWDQVKIP